jgi:hypothetical protein
MCSKGRRKDFKIQRPYNKNKAYVDSKKKLTPLIIRANGTFSHITQNISE